MIVSKRHMLFGILILSCGFAAAFGSEPNKPEAESGLKFETSDQEVSDEALAYTGRGRADGNTVRPTHMAKLFMSGRPAALAQMLQAGHLFETSTGKTLSKEQRAFMMSGSFSQHGHESRRAVGGRRAVAGRRADSRFFCALYAVSQDDARKMAKSFIEYVSSFSSDRRRRIEELKNKTEAGISETRKLILEKQGLAEAAALNFQTLKNAPRYAFLKDAEAWKEAKATIAESNRTLDVLDIELAGINEKLRTIEKYRAGSGSFSKAVHEKLEQMFVEQMVDLASAEARKRKALEIREQDGKLVKLFDGWDHLKFELNNLDSKLKEMERELARTEVKLADARMPPPEVYHNKVTIHPVVQDDQYRMGMSVDKKQ